MKNIKKSVIVLLVIAVLAAALCGCENKHEIEAAQLLQDCRDASMDMCDILSSDYASHDAAYNAGGRIGQLIEDTQAFEPRSEQEEYLIGLSREIVKNSADMIVLYSEMEETNDFSINEETYAYNRDTDGVMSKYFELMTESADALIPYFTKIKHKE